VLRDLCAGAWAVGRCSDFSCALGLRVPV